MTVDLSKAKAGQIAVFRMGKESKIIQLSTQHGGLYSDYTVVMCEAFITYRYDGRTGVLQSPFDIIEIKDAPFDWKDVRPGMSFVFKDCPNMNKLVYLGNISADTDEYMGGESPYNVVANRKHLIRKPEWDSNQHLTPILN